jgi:LPS-assembly lipoprotein
MMLAIGKGIKRRAFLAMPILLGGCGFHLAGSARLPAGMQTTWLVSDDPRSVFYGSLTEVLRQRGLQLVDARAEAGATLSISQDVTGQRILPVSARNIPREYEVFYQVVFSLETDGRTLIAGETLLDRRNYTYDETEVLGKEREEDTLRRALAESLAQQVVRRIEAVAAASNP